MDAVNKAQSIQSLQLELNRFKPVRQLQATAVQPRPAEEPAKAEASPKEDATTTEGKEKDRSVQAGLNLEA